MAACKKERKNEEGEKEERGKEEAEGEGEDWERVGTNHHTVFRYLMIVANACGLPAAIVPTGITLVQLEPIVRVPAHVQDGHSKRTLA